MEKKKRMTLEEVQNAQPPVYAQAEKLLEKAREGFFCKWIVLDDDPTGIQTVNGVSVYTDWSEESLQQGFKEERPLFFILTNSRGMTEKETIAIHTEIAERTVKISKETGIPFQIISRGDSTLRGHYPTETEVLKNTIERNGGPSFDGEILCPFFPQGGRYTLDDIHYVCTENEWIPAAETEFAKDKTFGYENSHLGRWVEEKTGGRFPASEQISISLSELREGDTEKIAEKIKAVTGFRKILVNALCYEDLDVFAAALFLALKDGKHFLYRTAATFPEVMGGVKQRPLLTAEELRDGENTNGGLIVVGSHVKKTTEQLKCLLTLKGIRELPFASSLVLDPEAFKKERERVQAELERRLSAGETVVVYTERTLLLPETENPEDALRLSLQISDAVTDFVRRLRVRPRFIIAKGGITSSEIGVKGLEVKRAEAAGQILPGIPVWKTGSESHFPGLPYVIFPGNVGKEDSLKTAVEKLMSE